MTTYVLKSSLCLIIFFGLYWFLLRREKLFVFNRFFLILSIVFSLVVPFISITIDLQTVPNLRSVIPVNEYFTPEIRTVNNNLSYAPDSIQAYSDKQPMAVNTSAILLTIYALGIIFFLIRFLRNIRFLSQRTKSSEKITFKGYRIVLIPALINPCCFLKSVYLNKTDYLNGKIAQALIDHEIEHAKQYHTIDIILIELVKIFYWFNPVYILYDRAIRINHEYLADNGVIKDKSDIEGYTDKLLNFITHRINLSLTSGTNHSFTRKRLTMLMRPVSGRFQYSTRIAVTLCLTTFVFLLLSFKETNNEPLKYNLSGTGTEFIQNNVRGIVSTEGGLPLFVASIKTISSRNDSVETTTDFDGRFTIEDILSGASLLIKHDGFKQKTVLADFKSEMTIKMVRDPAYKQILVIPVVRIVKFRNPDFTPAEGLIVINGKIVDSKGVFKVNPNEIKSLKAFTGKEAIKMYGDKAKDGILEIELYGFRNVSLAQKVSSGGIMDSSKYATHITVNHIENKGEPINLPVSSLQTIDVWTYYDLDNKVKKNLRAIIISTRDYYKVKGRVITEAGKPLPGVKITASDNPAVETTDKDGRFLINDVREGAILDFSMPEYKTYHLSTLYEVAFNIDLTVQLEKDGKENNDILEKAEKMPQYPGGDMELLKFIAMNTQYPETAKTEKAQGKVIVKFIVDTEGKVKDAVIFKGVHPALDAEALRVVGKLERFIPGTDGGNPVNVYYYLPITFGLPISNTQK